MKDFWTKKYPNLMAYPLTRSTLKCGVQGGKGGGPFTGIV